MRGSPKLTRLQKVFVAFVGAWLLAIVWINTISRYVFCGGTLEECIPVDAVGVFVISMIGGLVWALSSRAWKPPDPRD